jgi:hypothetical protein
VLKIAMEIIFVLVVEFVVKLIRMAPHTRLQKIQLSPTMDGIVLVMVNGLMHGATKEPIASMLDQVLVGLYYLFFRKVNNLTISFSNLPHLPKKVGGVFLSIFLFMGFPFQTNKKFGKKNPTNLLGKVGKV